MDQVIAISKHNGQSGESICPADRLSLPHLPHRVSYAVPQKTDQVELIGLVNVEELREPIEGHLRFVLRRLRFLARAQANRHLNGSFVCTT